jgi:hypothetical protein
VLQKLRVGDVTAEFAVRRQHAAIDTKRPSPPPAFSSRYADAAWVLAQELKGSKGGTELEGTQASAPEGNPCAVLFGGGVATKASVMIFARFVGGGGGRAHGHLACSDRLTTAPR